MDHGEGAESREQDTLSRNKTERLMTEYCRDGQRQRLGKGSCSPFLLLPSSKALQGKGDQDASPPCPASAVPGCTQTQHPRWPQPLEGKGRRCEAPGQPALSLSACSSPRGDTRRCAQTAQTDIAPAAQLQRPNLGLAASLCCRGRAGADMGTWEGPRTKAVAVSPPARDGPQSPGHDLPAWQHQRIPWEGTEAS